MVKFINRVLLYSIAQMGRRNDRMPEKKFQTIVFRYVSDDGDPTEMVPFFEERVVQCASILHEKGWGLDVRYGVADESIMDEVEED